MIRSMPRLHCWTSHARYAYGPCLRARGGGQIVRTGAQTPAVLQTPDVAAIDTVMREMAAEHPELLTQRGWSEMRIYMEMNAPPVPV